MIQTFLMSRYLFFVLVLESFGGLSAEQVCQCGKSSNKDIEWFAELYSTFGSYQYICNGVLISPWVVLTSSFCASEGKHLHILVEMKSSIVINLL